MPATEKKKAQDRARMQAKRQAERSRIEGLEAEVRRLNKTSTDRRYFMEAYEAMLGENGLKVAAMWKANKVERVHYSWGPEAHKLTGEERAAYMIEWATLPTKPYDDVDSYLTPEGDA